ncbi:4'-phosphopantetheinyl transferase superfamily protein [Nonomuraea sp. SBT364]|uniref:4'-phosphopantetheinyl transferase superfamily protein n=1 Tax=Nonomuraea sp. SBT364 TaxID=1580530 RepID=UPI00066BB678|nr:4'-phosphopantetheinyl transferase superfamily protein [Nonomuraea sp. SBT364]
MNAPAVLVGVDIVEAGRLARAADRGGHLLARHVATAAELSLGAGRAAFSVKESLIKAVGGRPPGFTWHDFEAVTAPPAAWARPLLDEAACELSDSTGLPLTGGAAYRVRGASARAALLRLNPGAPGTGPVSVAAAARWGEGGGVFVTLAIVYLPEKGKACP